MHTTHRGQTISPLHWVGFCLVTLLLNACATQGDIMDNLNKTLRGYEKSVRWAQFDATYSYHKWEDGQEASVPTSMEKIRVTQYESSGQKFDQKNKIMKQTVTLRYYNMDDQRERKLKHQHEWKYFPKLKRWYLISDPIAFP